MIELSSHSNKNKNTVITIVCTMCQPLLSALHLWTNFILTSLEVASFYTWKNWDTRKPSDLLRITHQQKWWIHDWTSSSRHKIWVLNYNSTLLLLKTGIEGNFIYTTEYISETNNEVTVRFPGVHVEDMRFLYVIFYDEMPLPSWKASSLVVERGR